MKQILPFIGCIHTLVAAVVKTVAFFSPVPIYSRMKKYTPLLLLVIIRQQQDANADPPPLTPMDQLQTGNPWLALQSYPGRFEQGNVSRYCGLDHPDVVKYLAAAM